MAGVKYILEVELGWTNCTKSQYTADASSCILDPTRDTFTCDFHVVEQSWINNKEVVQSKCYEEQEQTTPSTAATEGYTEEVVVINNDEVEDFVEPTTEPETILEDDTDTDSETDSDEPVQRRKRDTPPTRPNLGKIKDADEDNATLMEMAVFAVEQLDRVDEDTQARLVLDIIHAKKQVCIQNSNYTMSNL